MTHVVVVNFCIKVKSVISKPFVFKFSAFNESTNGANKNIRRQHATAFITFLWTRLHASVAKG